MVDFILSIDVALPPDMPAWQKTLLRPMTWVLAKGVVATYPRYMRDLLGLRQSRLTDLPVTPLLRAGHAVLHRSVPLTFAVGNVLAPAAMPTLAPVLLGIEPVEPVTMTPREAQAAYGYDVPDRAHPDLRARQRERVFEEHQAPSDEGLVESQQHIRPIDHRQAGLPA